MSDQWPPEGFVLYHGNKDPKTHYSSFEESIAEMFPRDPRRQQALLTAIQEEVTKQQELLAYGFYENCLQSQIGDIPVYRLPVEYSDPVTGGPQEAGVLFMREGIGKRPPAGKIVLLQCGDMAEALLAPAGHVGEDTRLAFSKWIDHEVRRKEQQHTPKHITRVYFFRDYDFPLDRQPAQAQVGSDYKALAEERLLKRLGGSVDAYRILWDRLLEMERNNLRDGIIGDHHDMHTEKGELAHGGKEMRAGKHPPVRFYVKPYEDVDGVGKLMVFLVGDKNEQSADIPKVMAMIATFETEQAVKRQIADFYNNKPSAIAALRGHTPIDDVVARYGMPGGQKPGTEKGSNL